MNGCDAYCDVTKQRLIGGDCVGYPGLHGLELRVTSRTTQTANDDDEMGQPHRHYERQHRSDWESLGTPRFWLRQRRTRSPYTSLLCLGTGILEVVEDVFVEEKRSHYLIQERLCLDADQPLMTKATVDRADLSS